MKNRSDADNANQGDDNAISPSLKDKFISFLNGKEQLTSKFTRVLLIVFFKWKLYIRVNRIYFMILSFIRQNKSLTID